MERSSGILLHITSLPSPYGIGDLGPEAYKFADFLAHTKQRLWQVLPLNPISQSHGNSPYSSISAFGGNIFLISPDLLCAENLLDKKDIEHNYSFPAERCDYAKVIPHKRNLLNTAYINFKKEKKENSDYELFCEKNSYWLEDYVLFIIIKRYFHGKSWNEWSNKLRDKNVSDLEEVKKKYKEELDKEKFFQYIFFKQWVLLKKYCNQRNIKLIGDLPIYVSYDSADVWANPENFSLDQDKKSAFFSGVPPDYFSETGQIWGNPVYRWDVLKETGYKWWVQRIEQNLVLFDLLRMDHFRGFVAFWQVPSEAKDAVNGEWIDAPAMDFFNTLTTTFPNLPIIVEDLGHITQDVKDVIKHFGFPGMRVLLFAFGEDNPTHPYLPHNFIKGCVVYTGTHDNNMVRGWIENEATPEEKKRVFRYIGREVKFKNIHLEFIRLLMMSIADVVIFPMQDLLGLGEEGRMNKPNTTEGNWRWRLLPDAITPPIEELLLEMTKTYGRASEK